MACMGSRSDDAPGSRDCCCCGNWRDRGGAKRLPDRAAEVLVNQVSVGLFGTLVMTRLEQRPRTCRAGRHHAQGSTGEYGGRPRPGS